MGTRSLTVAYLDGQHRIAQYGQWDGYPAGQGATVLDFLHMYVDHLSDAGREAFMDKLRAARFDGGATNPLLLSRDTGAAVLALLAALPPGQLLKDSLDFAGDSLFCEYAYVLDFDRQQLELYRGFCRTPPPPGERFSHLAAAHQVGDRVYYPIQLAQAWPFAQLPSIEDMERAVDRFDAAHEQPETA